MSGNRECLLCGEYLKLNKEGTMKNQNTGEFFYVYICEECNQAFILDNNDKLKFLPYDSSMKKIENKCKVCEIMKNFNEEGLFLLNVDTAYYEFHCLDCSIKILQNWLKENSKKKIKVTMRNIQHIYELYDFSKNHEMLQEIQKHPEKYKETKDKIMKVLEDDKTANPLTRKEKK